MKMLVLSTLSILFVPLCLASIGRERLYKRTSNVSSATWSSFQIKKRTLDTIYMCGVSCLVNPTPCNAFSFDAATLQCTHANVTYLEDAAAGDAVSIMVDNDVVDNVDQICRGGYHCCNRDKIDFPCQIGEGDCRNDIDCSPGLICSEGSCTKLFNNTGYQWDSSDNCCEPRCTYSHPCSSGEGKCIDSSGCVNSSWSQCLPCTNKVIFSDSYYTEIAAEGYSNVDLCCRRDCVPYQRCTINKKGCNTNEDCLNGLECRMTGGFPTCLDIEECNTTDICPAQTLCVNLIGSYRCIPQTQDMVAFMAGGENPGVEYVLSAQLFARQNKKCVHNVPNLPRPMVLGAAVYLNNKLYVCGGASWIWLTWWAYEYCFSLDLTQSNPAWTQIASMPGGRSCFMMVTYSNQIYVFSGLWDNGLMKGQHEHSVKYNPSTNSWTSLTNYNGIPSTAITAAEYCAVVDDVKKMAYVLGGYYHGQLAKRREVMMFDLVYDRWGSNSYQTLPGSNGAIQLGCAIMRDVVTSERILVVTGGQRSSYPWQVPMETDNSYYTYLDRSAVWQWTLFKSDAGYTQYGSFIKLNDYEAYSIGEFSVSSGSTIRNYLYTFIDSNLAGMEKTVGFARYRTASRYEMTAAIPRNSSVIIGCN